jgi:hypothetical protein
MVMVWNSRSGSPVGVVDQEIDAAALPLDGLHQAPGRAGLGEVGGEGTNIRARRGQLDVTARSSVADLPVRTTCPPSLATARAIMVPIPGTHR